MFCLGINMSDSSFDELEEMTGRRYDNDDDSHSDQITTRCETRHCQLNGGLIGCTLARMYDERKWHGPIGVETEMPLTCLTDDRQDWNGYFRFYLYTIGHITPMMQNPNQL
ncbi:hypothetical protein BDW42DRAFT_180883 [Aspergillus taichungensis]|uniref:Uncharacterized protein n=1 Tax=Aspergillus taichungensis TaxID=482145 RepID=A0A2J5HEP7_9EURO|nr:hypothetical protein BDW42DRAFT_180883 [Aspergillus taichungensis]